MHDFVFKFNWISKTRVQIGNYTQPILYEGVNPICFQWGRIGHRLYFCPFSIKTPNTSPNPPSNTSSTSPHIIHSKEPTSRPPPPLPQLTFENPGPWMLVTRRKTRPNPKHNMSQHMAKTSMKVRKNALITDLHFTTTKQTWVGKKQQQTKIKLSQ